MNCQHQEDAAERQKEYEYKEFISYKLYDIYDYIWLQRYIL